MRETKRSHLSSRWASKWDAPSSLLPEMRETAPNGRAASLIEIGKPTCPRSKRVTTLTSVATSQGRLARSRPTRAAREISNPSAGLSTECFKKSEQCSIEQI